MTDAATLRDIDLRSYERWGLGGRIQGTEAKLMTSKSKHAHFSFRMPIGTDFKLLKVDSFNNIFYTWMSIVSQQAKQDGYLEDSYETHLLMKYYAQTAQRTKMKSNIRKHNLALHLIREGKAHIG